MTTRERIEGLRALDPRLGWLVRSIDDLPNDNIVQQMSQGRTVYCHLCEFDSLTHDLLQSYKGFGNTPEEAWDDALAKISRKN